MIAWILAAMVLLQPSAPWKDSYEHTAKGILEGATSEPIFRGDGGVFRTVALDVSLAWFESRFNPVALGDKGRSWGLYQFQDHGKPEGVKAQTIIANRLIRESFRICAARPLEERLGWYAAGGNGCDRGLTHSRHRIWKAQWLIRKLGKPEITDT